MWLTVLVMALAVSTEPFRLGMTVVMLNRTRPAVDLLAFLLGGFLMGIAVGLVMLFGLRSLVDSGLDSGGSAHVTLPKVQIGLGLALLVAAAVVALRRKPDEPDSGAGPGRVAQQARRLMGSQSPWVPAVAGLGIALPSVDYLAALTVIAASGAPPAHQVAALVMFTIVAFALVEIPLIAYLFAPDRTRAVMARLNEWFAANRRQALAITLVVIGSVLLSVGILTL